jgi:DNA gyrase/topoisomerase IV subunit A
MEKIIDRRSDEMYVEDMVKYLIVINRRRAFPEVKDGLKVVERRILYDML